MGLLHIERNVMSRYIPAALSGKFQRCNSEEEGRTARPPRTAGERERSPYTQQNGVSKERVK